MILFGIRWNLIIVDFKNFIFNDVFISFFNILAIRGFYRFFFWVVAVRKFASVEIRSCKWLRRCRGRGLRNSGLEFGILIEIDKNYWFWLK